MNEGLKRLLREYNLISAAIVATVSFGSIMGWFTLNSDQWSALLGLIAAWMLVMRFLVTPVQDPVLKPGTTVNARTDTPTIIT